MTIREFTNNDLLPIKELLSELSGHTLTDEDVLNRFAMIRESKIDKLFVGEIDKQVIGLLAFRIRENIEEVSRFGEISAVIINQEYRHSGLGKQFIDYAEEYARSLNCKGTWLVSGFGREEQAHKFYRQQNYTATGYRFVKLF